MGHALGHALGQPTAASPYHHNSQTTDHVTFVASNFSNAFNTAIHLAGKLCHGHECSIG
eukprot:CAMPEP_0198110850 /NCGR_PEP_ID=MMETSP1442-20131203/2852_1 /TAXON_ID= /ORGANISM="Craspedostauros australis, Strain CCMP3328" /LENGTH=58 /DNA_ID=CAMNT_0043767067 /DNA_START=1 /DNA_END=174 /DNA_ORIENTATION=-